MLKRMGGLIAAAFVAVALVGCADIQSSLASGLQLIPSAPTSVTAPAQAALNKSKVALTAAAGLVHTYGDAAVLAAQLGALKGENASTAKRIYDDGVDGVNAANAALTAAQAAIDAGKSPNFAAIDDAVSKARDAAGKLKALVGLGGT